MTSIFVTVLTVEVISLPLIAQEGVESPIELKKEPVQSVEAIALDNRLVLEMDDYRVRYRVFRSNLRKSHRSSREWLDAHAKWKADHKEFLAEWDLRKKYLNEIWNWKTQGKVVPTRKNGSGSTSNTPNVWSKWERAMAKAPLSAKAELLSKSRKPVTVNDSSPDITSYRESHVLEYVQIPLGGRTGSSNYRHVFSLLKNHAEQPLAHLKRGSVPLAPSMESRVDVSSSAAEKKTVGPREFKQIKIPVGKRVNASNYVEVFKFLEKQRLEQKEDDSLPAGE